MQISIYKSSDPTYKVCETGHAYEVKETRKANQVWELTFRLPKGSEAVAYAQHFAYVRVKENGQVFTIKRITEALNESGQETFYYWCEHAFAMLLNDSVFGTYNPINLTTRQVLTAILAKQRVQNWVLGDCEFSLQFSYGWRNEKLMTMALERPEPWS